MARDFKTSFRFGSGVLGASGGNVQAPGTNITAFGTSFVGLTGTSASTTNAVSGQLISCPLAWGGFTQTANPNGPSYAEDVASGGVILPGHTSRNDLYAIVDVVVATTLVTAQTFVVQASDDSLNWVTIGTGDVTVPVTNPSNGTVALTIAAGTFNVLTASAIHGLQPGDLLVVTSVTTCNLSNGHENVLAVSGNVVEVNTVPSTTTFTIKYPGTPGTTLKSNALILSTLQVVASGSPALTFTKTQTTGVSVGAQVQIALAASAKPYIRLAAFGGASAAGIAVIRDAYLSSARSGVAR